MATDNRHTAWACILYPESTDIERFILAAKRFHVASALSPLHAFDEYDEADLDDYLTREKEKWLNEGERRPIVGVRKKEHYHWMVTFGRQKKSAAQVLKMIEKYAPTVKYVEPVTSVAKYLQYFTHQNDPDKYQYSPNDVRSFCGFDLSPLWSVTEAQEVEGMTVIIGWCREYGLVNWCDVVDLVLELGNAEYVTAMRQNQYLIKSYCESLHEVNTGKKPMSVNIEHVADQIRRGYDPNTGELFQQVA